MTNKEILKKAIIKASKNNFSSTECDYHIYYWIIFNHDFAKAFWGERSYRKIIPNKTPEGITKNIGIGISSAGWEHHLQKMVLEKEPLKYLEKFL